MTKLMTFDDPNLPNIAIIEDDEAIREVVKIVLLENGYEAFMFSGTKDFLEVLDEGVVPELIFLDIWLGKEDGRELAKLLKKRADTKKVPLVVFSANNRIVDIAKEVEADDVLPKPFDIEDLVKMIKKYLK